MSCRCEFCDEHASVERRSLCVFERGVKLRCTRGCGAFSKIAISHSLSIALSHKFAAQSYALAHAAVARTAAILTHQRILSA